MNNLDRFFPISQPSKPVVRSEMISQPMGGYSGYGAIIPMPYNGETDLGDLGPIYKYYMDHESLRMRSHQLDLDSDLCNILFRFSRNWVVGTGNKLQAAPKVKSLKRRNIRLSDINDKGADDDDAADDGVEAFCEMVEEEFNLWGSSSVCDFKDQRTMQMIEGEAFGDAEKGGDTLIVMRVVDGVPKIDLIDGTHLRTPLSFSNSPLLGLDYINDKTGNRVRRGVEMDKYGRQVAFWVQKAEVDSGAADMLAGYERIPRYMSTYPYSEMAWIEYGNKYRLDHVRGIPVITAAMETAKKMGRYMSASLGSAEERAKVAYILEHDKESTGEPIGLQEMAVASGAGFIDIPTDSMGRSMANHFQATTNKMMFNAPPGSRAVALESKNELNVKDFIEPNFDIVCAVVGYPPEMVLNKFGGSYSGSRGAIKNFEHILDVKRIFHTKQFNQKIYNFWLDVYVLRNMISAPGYLKALANKDILTLNAYRNAEWQGDGVPHIDPKVEVEAWRLKMGAGTEHLPLCTTEEAARAMSKLSLDSIMTQRAKEMRKADALGIEKVEPRGSTTEDFDDPQEDQPNKPGRKKGGKKQDKQKQ